MTATIPNNQFKEYTTLARMSVKAIRSVTPVLAHANTTYESIIMGPDNRSAKANYFKQGRATVVKSLSSSFESMIDRFGEIEIKDEWSASIAATEQQVMFDIKKGWDKYLKPRVAEMGTKIHNDVIQVFRTKTTRWYGNPRTTPINSYFGLQNAKTRMDLYGSTGGMAKGFIPASIVPYIVQSGLSDFATQRGDRDSFKWELSNQADTDWFKCTTLPSQVAGTVGKSDLTLTVVSLGTPDANGGITSIVFSGAPTSDSFAIRAYDRIEFQDGVSGKPNMRLLEFVGHEAIQHPVQMLARSNAASDGGGLVEITFDPPLQASTGQLQNINNEIQVGMQVKVLGDHTCGLIMQGDPLMLAFGDLPGKNPFTSVGVMDPETKVSMRLTYAAEPFEPKQGWAYNALTGKDLDDDNAIALIFPTI